MNDTTQDTHHLIQHFQPRLIALISYGAAIFTLLFALASELKLIPFQMHNPALNMLLMALLFLSGWLADHFPRQAQTLYFFLLILQISILVAITYTYPDRYLLSFFIGFMILFGFATLPFWQGLTVALYGLLGAMLSLIHLGNAIEPEARVYLMTSSVAGMLIGWLFNRHFHRFAEQIHRYHQELIRLAHTNEMTGLLNRRGFFEEARPRLSQCQPTDTLALALIDVDDFKRINDTWGHQAGDAALIHLAELLRGTFEGEEHLLARFGGDELAVLISAPRAQAMQRFEQLMRQLARNPLTFQGQTIPLSISVGIAINPPGPRPDIDMLIRHADQALYRAKAAGKGRIQTDTVPNRRSTLLNAG